jgi:mono/diheme cytochrome c family protein
MKKVLKILAYVLGAVILLIVIAALFVQIKGIPSYEVQEVNIQVTPTPAKIQRGKKLASMLCSGCHMNAAKGNLTGQMMPDAPKEFGTIYSANITQDKTFGIGAWTDGEIAFLLRTGIKRDGKYAPPYMAKLPKMADDDLEAIIAFLRSDDPLVAADNTVDPPTEPSFLTKMLCQIVFKPYPMPSAPIPMPDTTNMVELGAYLATNLECFSCHSADFKTNDYLSPEKSPGFYGGGNKVLNLEGEVVLTANITMDKETGIGSWSEEQFIKTLKFGTRDGKPNFLYPMRPYALLTDKEASAIFYYLKTVPPLKNQVAIN